MLCTAGARKSLELLQVGIPEQCIYAKEFIVSHAAQTFESTTFVLSVILRMTLSVFPMLEIRVPFGASMCVAKLTPL